MPGGLLALLCAPVVLLAPTVAVQSLARAQQTTDAPAQDAPAPTAPADAAAAPADAAAAPADAAAAPADAAAAPADAPTSTGDEIIVDPELSGIAPPPTPAPAAQAAAAGTPNGEVRLQLHSRVALDVRNDAPREDLWEVQNVALLEARVRRSETLRFALGLRVRHLFALERDPSGDGDADRTAFDLAPTAGYGEVTLADGLHLRLGYQSVRLGSFELLNASDVLTTYDLRSGPNTFPEASEIAQLAARVDWDAGSWLSFTLLGIPFFQPHRVSVFDGNYALFPPSQVVAPEDLTAAEETRPPLSRSAQARLADGVFAAFAPDPNLKQPQAALHALAHGTAGELRFTAALARDQIFTLTTDPLLGLEYAPFGLFSIEGAIEVGPMQLGAQLAYMLHRTLVTDSGDPNAIPSADQSDVTHLGVKLEHAQGDRFGFLIEASASRASAAGGSSGPWLGAFERRWYFAVAGIAQFAIDPVTLELAGGVTNGPSYLLGPRLELELLEGLSAEAGAYVVGAISPPASSSGWVVGDLYEHADQVYLGVIWIP